MQAITNRLVEIPSDNIDLFRDINRKKQFYFFIFFTDPVLLRTLIIKCIPKITITVATNSKETKKIIGWLGKRPNMIIKMIALIIPIKMEINPKIQITRDFVDSLDINLSKNIKKNP